MKKICIALLITSFLMSPLSAEPTKERLAEQLFQKADIEETLRKAGDTNFPGFPAELSNIFGADQQKFESIFNQARHIYVSDWVKKLTDSYKNLWVIAYTKNFTTAELTEMVSIYSSPTFKKFQEQFSQIDLSHLEQLKEDTLPLMQDYTQLMKKALLEAKNQQLDPTIINEELEKIDFTEKNIKESSDSVKKRRKNF